MNFFLNHALISLNTAPMPQNIFLKIIENHIFISNSSSVQVLHQQIRGVGGKTCADLADARVGELMYYLNVTLGFCALLSNFAK